MNASGRRCRQFRNGFRHLAKRGRPIYRSTASLSVADAIARERAAAHRQTQMNSKKKK